jgi:hypothetical protein
MAVALLIVGGGPGLWNFPISKANDEARGISPGHTQITGDELWTSRSQRLISPFGNGSTMAAEIDHEIVSGATQGSDPR